jgi:hypothetical protein
LFKPVSLPVIIIDLRIISEYGRDLDVAVKREMNSDLRRLMRILLHTEREEVEVNVAQAHKEAQVR